MTGDSVHAGMLSPLTDQAELVSAWRQTLDDHESPFLSELAETHVSWILLTREKAYKIKKALKLDFLDFSDLSSRRFYCEEEIRLNKRTAPGIYQEVVAIGGSIAAPRINAEPVLEYAVQMKRFPRENEMSRMLHDGRLEAGHIDSLAEKVADFHQRLPPLEMEGEYGTYDFIHLGLRNNYAELRALFSLPGMERELPRLIALQTLHFAVLEEKKHLIDERHANGFIRECHGDLHMGNIVMLDDEAIPFDSIEFAPDFRCVDVMCDLAFAFTDLLHFGRPDYAWRLLNRYLEETGDYQGACLLDIYGASHALVRAKVTALRCLQITEEDERDTCLEESREYLDLAYRMLEDRNAGLMITCGLPGAGK
ncbi:hypothetical protein LJC19_07630, partial [Oxalobacter sp. OttesenSCG-928-P03]|nr:hypothetical protein [Oxalobacter sp. OttesenSCG-928-P03]